jgi:hypothetical protein
VWEFVEEESILSRGVVVGSKSEAASDTVCISEEDAGRRPEGAVRAALPVAWAVWDLVERVALVVSIWEAEGVIIDSAEEATAVMAAVILSRKEGPGFVSMPTSGRGEGE